MTFTDRLPDWMVLTGQILFKLRFAIVVAIMGSTVVWAIASDYLEHRKERAEALEKSYQAVETLEGELTRILSETTAMWQTGEPIDADVLKRLSETTTEIFIAIDGVNRSTDRMQNAALDYRTAVAELRNAVIRYRHDEETVRALHYAIANYATQRDAFSEIVNFEIENYNRTAFNLV